LKEKFKLTNWDDSTNVLACQELKLGLLWVMKHPEKSVADMRKVQAVPVSLDDFDTLLTALQSILK
jgi:hypothetical protein